MTDRRNISDADLVAALTDLGQHLEYAPTPDIAHPVQIQLAQRARASHRSSRPIIFAPLIAVLALVISVVVLSPGARSAVASWFHIVGVRIESGSTPPGPIGHSLHLGIRESLPDAQTRVAFPILVPRNLGMQPEVYVGTPPLTDSVSLLYPARANLPRSGKQGARLLITEYQHDFLDVKLLPRSATVITLTIRGSPAVWISGMPHIVYDLDAHGRLLRDTIRLSGPVLVWYRHGVTVRIEGPTTVDRARAIARSMQPATAR